MYVDEDTPDNVDSRWLYFLRDSWTGLASQADECPR